MCSTGHYWGVQQEVMSSTGNYNVLNWTLLECSMGIIMCSTGHYWGAQWEFRCSMGGYVLNWSAQWEFRCSMGMYALNWTLLESSMGV